MPSLAPTRPIWIATEPGQLRYRQDFADWVARAATHLAVDVARVQAVVDDPQQDQTLFDKLVDYGLRKKRPPFRPGSMAPEMERLSGNDVPDCTECGQRHPEGERVLRHNADWMPPPIEIAVRKRWHSEDDSLDKQIQIKDVQKELLTLGNVVAVPGVLIQADEARTRKKYYQSHFYVQNKTCEDPFLGYHELYRASMGGFESSNYWMSPSPSSSLQARTPQSCSISRPSDTPSRSGSSGSRQYMPGLHGLQDEISDLKKELQTVRDGKQAAEEKQKIAEKLLENERSAKKAAEVAHAARVKEIENERDSARRSFRQLDEKQRQWQASLQMVRDGVISVNELKAKVAELEQIGLADDEGITSLEQEKTQLETALDLANEKKTELKTALDSANKKLLEAAEREAALEAARSNAVVQLNAAVEAANEAKKVANKAEEAKEAATKALKAASDDATTSLRRKDQSMGALKKRIKTLSGKVAGSQTGRIRDLKNSQTKVVSLQNKLETSQNKVDSLENELKTSQTKVTSLENELETSQNALRNHEEAAKSKSKELQSLQAAAKSSTEEMKALRAKLETAKSENEAANIRIEDAKRNIRRIREERTTAQTELQLVKRSMDELSRVVLATEHEDASSGPALGIASKSGRMAGPNGQLDVFSTKSAPLLLVSDFYVAYRAYKNSSGNNLEIKIKVLRVMGQALRADKVGNFVPHHRPGEQLTGGAELSKRLVLAAQSTCHCGKNVEHLPTRANRLKMAIITMTGLVERGLDNLPALDDPEQAKKAVEAAGLVVKLARELQSIKRI
ncbi:hypothetical protein FFLO_06730 [Filobasidium floriforme]|uniref:Uncharacterized protein n=1 Tax=Filobasidium floriforme TaxID=5210 RepID=A0A8K0NMR4_9TREE|nr:uncharacterized protein HD553DRAFT_369955 [Filobasidium floriforme]KAG7527650.1 hypothetical protein FFLO_06730 [Filobasidium floriforme]KAH8086509.1 hypothetical protein HD553DRAFT_369955 [Filobasidium floriforme]